METPPSKPPGECPHAPRPDRHSTTRNATPTQLDFDNNFCGYAHNLEGEFAKYNGSIGAVTGAFWEQLSMKAVLRLRFDGENGSARHEASAERGGGPLELYLPLDKVLRLNRVHAAAFLRREWRFREELAADSVSSEEFCKLKAGPFPAQLAPYLLAMDDFFVRQPISRAADTQAKAPAAKPSNAPAGASQETPGAHNVAMRRDGFSRFDFQAEHERFETEFFAELTVDCLRNPRATKDQLAEAAHAHMDEFENIMPVKMRVLYAYERYCVSSFDSDKDALALLDSLLSRQLKRAPELRANVVCFGS